MASAIGSGRWIQSASGPSGLAPVDADGVARVADHRGVGRDVGDHDAVGADLGAVADRDRPEQLGARPDRHVVLHGRVALAGGEARAAERHALIERDVVADLRRLADHDADAVVDEQAVADLRGRMDLDAGHRARRQRDRAGDERDAGIVQRVGDAVGQQRVDAGPAREDLERRDAARRRVAIAGRGEVAADLAGDPRQRAEAEHADVR